MIVGKSSPTPDKNKSIICYSILFDRCLHTALALTFMFMTAWVFEVRHYPTLLNEIKKTKL